MANRETLSSFWGKLQIGMKLRLTVTRPDNSVPIIRLRTICIKQSNAIAMTGLPRKFDTPDHTLEDPVWYNKPPAKVCQFSDNTLEDIRPKMTLKYEILSPLATDDVVITLTTMAGPEKNIDAGTLGSVVSVDGDNAVIELDGWNATVSIAVIRKIEV